MCLIHQQKVEDAENYFYKHGVSATLIGRLIPAIRQLISIPAGLSKMNIWKFMVYTSIGAGVWNAVLVALELFCHTLIDKDTLIAKISHYCHIIGYAALALVAAIIIFLIYKGAKNPKKK
jgi:membrane protein DedA with SNARE-associated domain